MAYYAHHQRRSIFGGIVLILIGVIFLVHEFRPDIGIGPIFERYWPLLLVLWGVALLLDRFLAGWLGGGAPSAVSGGEIALIIVLLLVVAGIAGYDWARKHTPGMVDFDMSGMFDHPYDWKTDLPPVPANPGSPISIVTHRGNITVNSTGDNKVHVSVDKVARASSEEEAKRSADSISIKITPQDNGYRIEPQIGDSGDFQNSDVQTDLIVLVPQKSIVSAQTNRGDIKIASMNAPVTVSSKSGDLNLHDVSGDVTATMTHGDTTIDTVKGNVRLDGRGGEVDVSNVTGDATILGEFYGPIRARNIGQTTRFTSSVSNLTVGKLAGEMEMDSGDFSISDVSGSFTLNTRNKDITIDNVMGRIDLTDTHGDINLHFAQAPRDDVRIADQSGNIDITIPAHSSFTISAISRSGEIQNDFEGSALKSSTSGETTILQGSYGTGGPRITLSTTYGTISIHKAQ